MKEAKRPQPALRRAPAARDRLCDSPDTAIVFSAEGARANFEAMLRLRAAAAAEPGKAAEYAKQAIGVAWGLNNFLLGWAALAAGSACGFEAYASASEEERRLMLAKALGHGLPVMGVEAADELRDALLALNGGEEVHPLLRPKPTGRRGSEPNASARAELRMLAWLEFRKGFGDRPGEALDVLIRATDRPPKPRLTPNSLGHWKNELQKVFGETFVRDLLEASKDYGRDWAAAHPFPPVYDPYRPEDERMWRASRWVPRTGAELKDVIDGWKRATAKRGFG